MNDHVSHPTLETRDGRCVCDHLREREGEIVDSLDFEAMTEEILRSLARGAHRSDVALARGGARGG